MEHKLIRWNIRLHLIYGFKSNMAKHLQKQFDTLR